MCSGTGTAIAWIMLGVLPMPHAQASVLIHAPQQRVAQLYRDYAHWPQLFPATIRGVRLVDAKAGRTELEIDHREGLVPNVMTEIAPDRIDLWESKRRYDGFFVNRFEPVRDGTKYTISADIQPKGAAKLLVPLLRPYIRHQLFKYVLTPMRRAAESPN
jgi:hypothetical protein